MEGHRILEAALGWLQLDLPAEALDELQSLGPRERMGREALELRLTAEIEGEFWNAGADTARLLCMKAPREGQFFIHAAYCLHETGDTAAARNWLLGGPSELIEEPLFHYNMACYHAVLGDAAPARSHLDRAIEMDASLKEVAASDADLLGLVRPT